MAETTTNELRHYITLMSPTRTTDDYGQSVVTYTATHVSVPAKMVIKSNREANVTDKLVSSYEYEFTVRFNQPVTADMIVKYQDLYYSIFNVMDKTGTRKMKTIVASLVNNQQGIVE